MLGPLGRVCTAFSCEVAIEVRSFEVLVTSGTAKNFELGQDRQLRIEVDGPVPGGDGTTQIIRSF